MDTNTRRLYRHEVPEHMKWDLRDLFHTQEEWEKEFHAVRKDIPSVTRYQGRIAEGPDALLACIDAREALLERLIHVATYAKLNLAADGTDPINQANCSKVGKLKADINQAISFIKTEILALPNGLVDKYINDRTGLEKYAVHLHDLLDHKPHTLHPETEETLAALGEVFNAPYTVYEQSKASDMTFPSIQDRNGNEIPVSFSLYENQYETSPDHQIRRSAYQSFTQTLKQYQDTYASLYATEIKKQVTTARLRNYPSVTDMLLDVQKVNQGVYHQQLDIILEELAPHMRRFAHLKKRVLGLDEMKFCDLKAELNTTHMPETTYEEASQLIIDSVKIMGEEYTNITKMALENRWADLSDNIGKASGAFCSSPYGKHPYVFLSWAGNMQSAFTLTHELGHAVHSYLSGKHQIMSNVRSSYYFVEAPSTLNELLLGKHLLSQTNDPRMKRWIILQLLSTYYHNFVTHLLEAELQRRVYQLAEAGNPITSTVLNREKGQILSSFWGDAVKMDEGASLTWMRQPHYYEGLYPYTYSAGLTVSTAVFKMIEKEGDPAIESWLNALKAGGSKKPLDLIQDAGIDMTKKQPIQQAVSFVGSLIDELEKYYEPEQ